MVVLKFRVWDKELKAMFELKSLVFTLNLATIASKNDLFPSRTRSFDDIIFMQSTGLFDDSTPKKEIFEGDIVETIYNGELFTGVIVYDQEETGFKATNGRNEYGNNFCYLGGNDSIIVIGNIYQNPELLKEVGNDTEV